MAFGRLSRAWRTTTHRPTLLSKNKTKQNHHHLLREGPMLPLVPAWKYCPCKFWNFFFLKIRSNISLPYPGYQKQDATNEMFRNGNIFQGIFSSGHLLPSYVKFLLQRTIFVFGEIKDAFLCAGFYSSKSLEAFSLYTIIFVLYSASGSLV